MNIKWRCGKCNTNGEVDVQLPDCSLGEGFDLIEGTLIRAHEAAAGTEGCLPASFECHIPATFNIDHPSRHYRVISFNKEA